METLWYLDTQLFFFINHLPHTGLLDRVALFFSWVGGSGILWALLCYVLFVQEEEKDHWFFLPFVLAGGLSVFATQFVLKPFFQRIRPYDGMGALVIGGVQADYSFPSSHATLAWALAVVLSREEPRARWIFYGIATLVSVSRIYLGKHYPSDVFAGVILGACIGLLAMLLERSIIRRNEHKRRRS